MIDASEVAGSLKGKKPRVWKTAIDDLLHAASYKTAHIGDEVNVHYPVYKSIAVSSNLVFTGWQLIEIRSISEAWLFVGPRVL